MGLQIATCEISKIRAKLDTIYCKTAAGKFDCGVTGTASDFKKLRGRGEGGE